MLERDGINLIQSGWSRHKTADQMIVDASDQIEEADALVENANKVKDLADAHSNEALVEKMQDISEEFKTAAEVFGPFPRSPLLLSLLQRVSADVFLYVYSVNYFYPALSVAVWSYREVFLALFFLELTLFDQQEKAAKADEYKAEAETIKAEQEAAAAAQAGGEEEAPAAR